MKDMPIWNEVIEVIQSEVADITFETCFRFLTPLTISENTFFIKAESQRIQKVLKERQQHYDLLEKTIQEKFDAPLKILIVTNEDLELNDLTIDDLEQLPTLNTTDTSNNNNKDFSIQNNINTIEPADIPNKTLNTIASKSSSANYSQSISSSQSIEALNNGDNPSNFEGINSKYIFDSFVVGNSNRLAHAASLSVATAPAQSYNPLFLYGNSGLGKTHLMHSIANHILSENPDSKVLYVTTETFTNELIMSIQKNKNEDFRDKYRHIDVLLIDDIQFISKKDGTQEEFFHTFNALYDLSKQIIISSDRPPKAIETLDDRLSSRLVKGLTVDIQPPDYETRMAILKKKSEDDNLTVSDEVTAFIAKNIASNIRELEGALTRVVAFSKITNEEIDINFAEKYLKDLFSSINRTVDADFIQEIVASHYQITIDDLKGSKKPKNIVIPRQIAMYLCRKHLDLSLPKIGEHFGGRDHTTVLHNVNKVTDNIIADSDFKKNISILEDAILNNR